MSDTLTEFSDYLDTCLAVQSARTHHMIRLKIEVHYPNFPSGTMYAVEQGLDYNLIQIDLSSKPSWFRQINTSGLVPAVEYDGKIFTESSDICR